MKHLHTASWLLAGLALSAFLLAEPAWAAPCTASAAECTEWVAAAEGSSRLLVYRSHPLEVRNAAITRGLVVVHGGGRNGDGYFRDALAAAFLAGALEDTIVISPRFASNNGGNCRDVLAANELNWRCGGREGWGSGGGANGNGNVTSFDMADEILRKLARKEIFPNLSAIVVAGHSAGGGFVTRYSMSNAVHEQLGVPVAYVVANSGGFAYLDSLRPSGTAFPPNVAPTAPGYLPPEEEASGPPFVPFPDARSCTAYDNWPYGLQNRAGYSARFSEDQLRKRVASRQTTYLQGGLDVLPPAVQSCPATAQGPTRLARGLAYAKHVNEKHGARHKTVVIPPCGHSSRCMFTAEPALPIIFPEN
jgi:pimeloyl-ACP methyl ester carboxylesterase